MAGRQAFFATTPPGLEPALHAEARELGLARLERQVGGLYFEGQERDMWRANLWLRTATRVLLRIARYGARDSDELYAGARELPWERWLAPEGTLWIDARCKESAILHSRFAEQRVKDAIADRFRAATGTRPSVAREDPSLRVDLHLYRDRATLSIDTSGEPLHKRGWRRYQGRAPLSECLAAGIVLLSGWDRRAPLVDPFCGSGTILVEAALFAAGRAPGAFGRSYAFESLPGHDARAFAAERERARSAGSPPPKLRLFGAETDAERLAGARANLEAAGLAGAVELVHASALELELRRGWNAWIVTNPPWGERVGDERDLARLWSDFGARLARDAAGYRLAILSGNPRLARALDPLRLERLPLRNGPLEVELLTGEVPAAP